MRRQPTLDEVTGLPLRGFARDQQRTARQPRQTRGGRAGRPATRLGTQPRSAGVWTPRPDAPGTAATGTPCWRAASIRPAAGGGLRRAQRSRRRGRTAGEHPDVGGAFAANDNMGAASPERRLRRERRARPADWCPPTLRRPAADLTVVVMPPARKSMRRMEDSGPADRRWPRWMTPGRSGGLEPQGGRRRLLDVPGCGRWSSEGARVQPPSAISGRDMGCVHSSAVERPHYGSGGRTALSQMKAEEHGHRTSEGSHEGLPVPFGTWEVLLAWHGRAGSVESAYVIDRQGNRPHQGADPVR